ncbi:hypothetical protein LVO79_21585 (plasmid) [Roseivivax marinus]|uniref:hypothetical protein n=1 Tax=Roseivivax marinus TaxID=1379903 RepID=UPI001F04BD0B|nr:hypothetical protein [Roseivivax marinus]UMA67314.1 hypothetical protein LVO79_21585 [Roseivivax marinus]
MTKTTQSTHDPSSRAQSLVLIWPGTLGHPSEWEMNEEHMFSLVTSFLETVGEHDGNIVVIESRWWQFQEGYMRYLIDQKLVECAAKGYAARKVLDIEDDDEVQEFDEVIEWRGFGGQRPDLIFREEEALWLSLQPILNKSDVLIAGGWRDVEYPQNSPIDNAVRKILAHCTDVNVSLSKAILEH